MTMYPVDLKNNEKSCEWGSPMIFTLIGGACVPSVITFGT
jgi:hypothetical protein